MLLMGKHLGTMIAFVSGSAAVVTRLASAAVVTVAFTIAARLLRAVTWSGAIAGAIVSFILYFAAGPGAFIALIAVFVLATIATRFGYTRKRALGTAEKTGGRTASQVVANIGIAALSAALFAAVHNPIMLAALSAALAEAAADTVSSECGQALSDRARLITSWRTVPAGTDGGITVAGTLAGVVAAFVVAAVCVLVGLISRATALAVWISGVLGMLFDSLLGAFLERRKLLNNDAVNFFSTVAAALLVIALLRVL
jgi:uncharacterized protein (TIGR00297 family)